MRNLHTLDALRVRESLLPRHLRDNSNPQKCGAFVVSSPIDKAQLRIIAAAGYGWEHVSVSRVNRCPNWIEMCHIKSLFFEDYETVMQLHVPTSEHINHHPNCLHLWRPTFQEIPRPPGFMVGGMSLDESLEEVRKLDPVTGLPLEKQND